MAATPAWPPNSAPRLYVEEDLAENTALRIDGNAAHYLLSVMRIREGDGVLLFNGRDGEWAARATDCTRRVLTLTSVERTRPLENVPDLWLCLAPIKKARIDLVMEKACELGVARVQPVSTRRAVVDRLNYDRLRAQMIEAAEQCGRTTLPHLDEMTDLSRLLAAWPADRHLFFADETGGESLSATMAGHKGAAAILIGPEGGFAPEERDAIRALPQAVPISLGPRILRAETAAIAAISCWMATNGDW